MREVILATAFLWAFTAVFAAGSARADVRLPHVISDNMVLQRDMSVPVWGWAAPGEEVTVSIAGQSRSAVAGADGKWTLRLDPMDAGGPYDMTVSGANALTVKNVLVGEVWLSSGQSNMQMRVREVLDAEKEVASAGYARIRLMQVPHIVAHEPQDDILVEWVECSPETIRNFSAIHYFFGRKIHNDLGVPVGLIHDSWSGSLIEPWISPETLTAIPEAAPLLDAWKAAVARRGDTEKAACEAFEKEMAAWREGWPAAQSGRKPDPPEADNPFDPLTNFQQPFGLYNGMICPVAPYAVRGVLWCQGEGNSDRSAQYRAFFPALIRDWRRLWGQGAFPFLFVQASSYRAPLVEPKDEDWPQLREAQTMTLKVPNTAMAVSTDVGDATGPHYKNKQAVGLRLALAAEAMVHGMPVTYQGPMYESMRVEDGRIRVHFGHAEGLATSDGAAPRMFQIAGADRQWVWADAAIDGSDVLVWSDRIADPAAVRYAWADNALAANLVNGAGLPAGTFRTDDWPVSTEGALVWEPLEDYLKK